MRRDAGGFFGPATTAGHEGDRDIPRGTKKEENQGPPRATKGGVVMALEVVEYWGDGTDSRPSRLSYEL